jgi:legumain
MWFASFSAVALPVLLAATVVAPHGTDAAPWAVIVAGSSGYFNYRHQADACHAYHVLINRGVPAKNIITMIYDDVASSFLNPFPNKLFNKVRSLSNQQHL